MLEWKKFDDTRKNRSHVTCNKVMANIHICMSHVARSIMEVLFQNKSTKYILMTKGELNHLQSFNGYLKKKRRI